MRRLPLPSRVPRCLQSSAASTPRIRSSKVNNRLSRRMASRNSTVTGIVDRMEAAGLVARERSAEDRRVWKIRSTERGREIAREVEVAPWDLLRSALAALPEDELGRLIATLEKVAGHVQQAVAAADAETDAEAQGQGDEDR